MRNLKRALSLTLASVMLLGMMVVGSSAAGYDDVKETDNVEAIEVLQAIGVMVGDERGFGPDRPVNRAEMAVVMALLLNLDYNYYVSTCPFNDVYDWARGPVGACYANKIVSGRGEGVYDPGSTVTAVEAASMLMRALGYFQYANDYEGGFELATVREGSKIRIFDGVGSSATEPMTRNQVAQMVLNALQTGMVEPDGNTINLTTPDGSVLTGKVNYVNVTSAKPFAYAIKTTGATSVGSTNDGAIVELGEQLYNGSLKLNERTMDDFYRPTRTWEYDSKTIGSYVKKELLKAEYTDKVTGRVLYDLLSKDVIDNYDFEIAIDGVNTDDAGARDILTAYHDKNTTKKCTDKSCSYFTTGSLVRSNTDGVGRTGKGVLTQVYVDASKDVEKVYIAVINTYLAIADKDYDSKRDEITLTGYNMVNNGSGASPIYVKEDDQDVKLTVDGEDFAIEDVKKDDKFLVTVADGRVQSMAAPEVLSEVTINAFKKNDWVNADGTQYNHATTARYDEEVLEFYDNVNMKEVTYNVVLDQYGYLIGLELNEKANQYVFITGTDAGESNLYDTNAKVNAIFLDGTMETITVNAKKSNVNWKQYGNHSQVNTWCTYTKDSKDIYTLTQVGIDSTVKAAKKVAQSAMDAAAPATGVGEFDINTKNVSLHGSKVANPGPAPAAEGDFLRVYGNDDTVYINAKMEEITVKDGDKKMVIVTDVDSVTTGVKNVDMTVKNHTKTGTLSDHSTYEECAKNEAYILYNKDGYIIGVVTLAAEDKGTSAKYAYITGGVNKEEYLGNDEWKWSQNAIIDGKKVVLTEVDDTRAYLNTTEVGKWYEVRFDSKGNVSGLKENDKLDIAAVSGDPNRASEKAAKKITGSEIYFDFNKDRFINDMDEVWAAVNGKSDYETSKTVLLFVDYCTGGTGSHKDNTTTPPVNYRADLSFKNGTLYTDTAQTEGFSVSPNVNVVLALAAKNHGSAFDDVDDGYTGYAGVEAALKNLDKSADAFDGYLCAVIEDGAATSIIFDERAGANRNDLEPVKPMTMIVTQVDENDNVLGTKTFTWDGTTPTGTEVTAPTGYTYKTYKNASAFVEGQTGTVTFVYSKNGGLVLPTNAVAMYNGSSNAFAVLYSGAAPSGNSLAALLIDAANKAGFPNAQAERNSAGTGWTITDGTGSIKLNSTFLDASAQDSWVGKVNNQNVYVKKSTALSALTTFGNSNVATAASGTYVKVNSATGLSATVTSGTDTFAAVSATVTADGFDVTTQGYVTVTGDGISGTAYAPYDAEYTAPEKPAGAHGTGFSYASGAKHVTYGGKIPAADMRSNVVLAKDAVKITYKLADALKTAGWSIDETETSNIGIATLSASISAQVKVDKTAAHGLSNAQGSKTTCTPSGVTAADNTSTASASTATLKFTVSNAATIDADIEITITDIKD